MAFFSFSTDEVIYANVNEKPPVPQRMSSLRADTPKTSLNSANEGISNLQIQYRTTSENRSKPIKMLNELKQVLQRKDSVRLPTLLGISSRKSLSSAEILEYPKPIAYIPPLVASKDRESVSSFDSWDDNYYEPVSTPASSG